MQRDFGTGVLKDRRPPCMKNFNAFKLEEDKGMVDGDCHPYGHRAGVNTDNDQYLPLRSSGPMYSGSDYPNVGRLEPGEHAWLVLHFFGETVDTLNGGVCLAQGGTSVSGTLWEPFERVSGSPMGTMLLNSWTNSLQETDLRQG